MAETYQGEMENEAFIENIKKYLKDGCGFSLGTTGSPFLNSFWRQFLYFLTCITCLELSNDKLNLVILVTILAFTHSESVGV